MLVATQAFSKDRWKDTVKLEQASATVSLRNYGKMFLRCSVVASVGNLVDGRVVHGQKVFFEWRCVQQVLLTTDKVYNRVPVQGSLTTSKTTNLGKEGLNHGGNTSPGMRNNLAIWTSTCGCTLHARDNPWARTWRPWEAHSIFGHKSHDHLPIDEGFLKELCFALDFGFLGPVHQFG